MFCEGCMRRWGVSKDLKDEKNLGQLSVCLHMHVCLRVCTCSCVCVHACVSVPVCLFMHVCVPHAHTCDGELYVSCNIHLLELAGKFCP